MKKYLVLLTICIYSFVSNAQNVGIGTPNPQNKLHVGGGFRLDTLTGVGGAGLVRHDANGVVYGIKFSGNTNDVLRGDGTFGPYNPAINGALGWFLTGNSGTNPTTNFIGTIDDASLVFKIRNLHSGVIDSASRNSSFGYRSLSQPSPGFQNTAFGYAALLNNNGFNNVAIGVYAMEKNTNGLFNNAIGNFSLQNNIQGSENVALGYAAMFNNSTGNDNTAVGLGTLFSNTTGVENTAIGHNALWRNTTASYNTSVGVLSLGSNTIGSANTAIGHKALEQNTNGSQNTATGYGSLQGSRGSFNSAFGYGALINSSLADHNSAFGRSALRLNTGLGNTAIGSSALENNISGTLNSAVGALAGYGLPNNVSNVTCIGYQTGWNTTLSNQVNIGNFSVTWIGGQTGWFHYSDKRIKNDIKDDVPGLSFISRLKPITYHVDIDKQEEIVNGGKITTTSELIKPVKNDWEGKYDVEKIKMTGFFAQDVEEAAKAINYSFNGVHNPKNGGLYSLDYSAFVVPLVKAVQEQQKIIEDQNKKIDKQQQQIDLLIKEMQSLKKDLITQKN